MASISSTDSPRPPGRIDSALSTARSSISLQPPAPGSKPTPTSTNPMYSSACGCSAAECSEISVPPPRVKPKGAATTGFGENLIAWVMPWKVRIAKSTSSHSSSWIDISSSMRFAPTEKFWASLVMTNASNASPGPPGFKVCEMSCTMSLPIVFILEWNSIQATPSPRSTSDAPEFFFTTPFAFLATSTDQTPLGTLTGS